MVMISAASLMIGGCEMTPIEDQSAPSTGTSIGAGAPGHQPVVGGDDTRDPTAVEGVVGIVRDATGRPLAGVLVEATAEAGAPPAPDLAIVTDRFGRFAWPLTTGTYRLSARGATVKVTVRPGVAVSVELIAR